MGLLMGVAFLPGVERESDSIQPGLIFLYYGGSRSRRRDPIRKKVKHCVNIISTLLLLLFLPSPLLTAAVQGKGIVSIISVIGEREEEREEGGFFFFISRREILFLPTTLNLLSPLYYSRNNKTRGGKKSSWINSTM